MNGRGVFTLPGSALLVFALLCVACGSPTGGASDSAAIGTWNLQHGSGPEGEIDLVDGFPVTLTFDSNATFGGTAACNGYGGRYEISGERLEFGEFGWTQMGCQNDVQAAEAAFLAALLDVDAIEIVNGELALSGPSTELAFSLTPNAPIGDVTDRTWLLETTVANGVSTAVEGAPATLQLQTNGAFIASTGCRDLVGRYVVFGGEINFNEMRAEGECPASLAAQDSSVIGVLGDGFTPEVTGEQLFLSSQGKEALRYRDIDGATGDELTGTEVVTDQESLTGIDWVFVGGDGVRTISDPRSVNRGAGTRITLTFLEDSYEGLVACNRYEGSAEIGVSLQSLEMGAPTAEQKGCGEPFDGPESPIESYLDALPQMSEGGIGSDGNLTLNGNDIELHFERSS